MSRKLHIGETEHKSFGTFELKSIDAGEPGEFEALVAVFGNVDGDGDRLVKGAFTRTLTERGFPAIVWTHDRLTVPVGVSKAVTETDQGLLVKGRFFIAEDEDHAIARQVYAAMKAIGGDGRPALRDWSFGYRTVKAQWVTEADNPDAAIWGGEIRELLDVDLWECGPTLVGANQAASTLALKSQGNGESKEALIATHATAVEALAAAAAAVEAAGINLPVAPPVTDPAAALTAVEAAEAAGSAPPIFEDRPHAARVAELLVTHV